MEIPQSYFEDEVRDGFYVPGMMKRAWGAYLEVIKVFDKICKKHDIKYFAFSGTLLGAVRHHGFIPWDDDLDFCMLRNDYNRFLKVAGKELPESWNLINIHTNTQYTESYTRLVNEHTINFTQEHLVKWHGFPFITGIDLFPLDYVSPDKQLEEYRMQMAVLTFEVARYMADNGSCPEEMLKAVEDFYETPIDRSGNIMNQVFKITDKVFTMFDEKDAREVVFMSIYCRHRSNKFKKEYFKQAVEMDFEGIKIPVPACYDAVLREQYGDYMHLNHSGGMHDYPFYQKQIDAVKEKINFSYPEYKFSVSDLPQKRHIKNASEKLRDTAEEMLAVLKNVQGQAEKLAAGNAVSQLPEILQLCQDGAIKLGTFLEENQGKATDTVKLLEKYCENIYRIYQNITGSNDEKQQFGADFEPLKHTLDMAGESIKKDMPLRREVVFLPFKASAWGTLEHEYKKALEAHDCDVYVIPVPYYYKNSDWTFGEMHYEGAEFPDGVKITPYTEYDFEKSCPDVIYIQNPYDSYNVTLSVPPFFYAKNLRQYTNELIYVPWFVSGEIHAGDEKAVENMRGYVTMPGVVSADKVIVQSAEMKKMYVEVLSDFAGEDTKNIWEEKISVCDIYKDNYKDNHKDNYTENKALKKLPSEWKKRAEKPDGSRKKIILYYNSISCLIEYGSGYTEKIKRTLDIFRENSENVCLIWHPGSLILQEAEKIPEELRKEYRNLAEEYRREDWGIYDISAQEEELVNLCDAYYGDADNLVRLFCEAKKPVMLQCVEI